VFNQSLDVFQRIPIYRYYGIQVNIVHSRRIRVRELLPGNKKKRDIMMHVMDTSPGIINGIGCGELS